MKRKHWYIVGGVALAVVIGARTAHVPTVPPSQPAAATSTVVTPAPGVPSRIGPASLYPDPSLTPGKADTLSLADLTKTYTDNCPNGKTSCTYSQDHRNVPAAEHTKVYDEYNVLQSARNIQSGEVDHFYPLCAGGSNDISNLWYQPIQNSWNGTNYGFKLKDDLETYVCAQIKAGKMQPQDAFSCVTTDWVKCYQDLKPPHQTFAN